MGKEITFDKFIRWAGVTLIVLAVLYMTNYLSSVLLPFFIAWFFAYLLYPVVKFIENKLHVRIRALSILIAMGTAIAVIGGVLWLIIPPMIDQFDKLGEVLTRWLHQTTHTNNLTALIKDWLQANQEQIEHFLKSKDFSDAIKTTMPKVFSVVSQTATVLMSIVASMITLLYMFFILLDYETLTANWVRIFPKKNRPFWSALMKDVERELNNYIRGQGLVALCMGIMFCIGFTIIGFPMAIGLGILIGIMDLVPYLHTFALIPTAFLAMLKAADTGQNFWLVFGLAFLVFCVVQVITDMVVTPKIMGKAMGLNPAILLLSLSPWVTEHLIYIYQDWRIINWTMTGALLVALIVYVTTHDFRFMKPLPFISLDYLGCILWSAWMLEFIFFFTYGEHYNWLDSKIMQMDVLLFIITGYFCIQRMLHIRHPYIAPAAWKYKRLIPLLILFAFVEFMGSTPKVLQTAFTGGVLHFGTFTTNVLNFVEWVGAIAGCLFCLFWCKVLHQKYTRLLTIGVATMVCYPVMMYFLIDPGLNIEALYLPIFLRSIGNAIFFCMLTIYLEELMPFEHFFMGLTMAGIIRNGPVSAMCSGLYSYGLRHQMAENMSRGLPYDAGNLLMISIRELYGLTCLIGIGVLIIFLLWDIQPIRSTLKKMPAWNFVGRKMKKNLA